MAKSFIYGLLAVAFVSIFGVLSAQNVTLNFLHASPEGSDVLVSWEIPSEEEVTEFRVYRKLKNEFSFKFLDKVDVEGKFSYTYLDYTIYKDEPKEITYKLQVLKNGKTYNFTTTIVHNPTSVQRTWGSIKAMFR